MNAVTSYLGGSGGDLVTAILLGEVTANARGSGAGGAMVLGSEFQAARSLNRVNSTGGSRRNSTLGGGGRIHGRLSNNGRMSVACILGPQGSQEMELTPVEHEQKKRREKEKMEKRINEMVIGDFY